MSTSTPKTYTVEEYLKLERSSEVRHEFQDGTLVAMAGDKKVNNRIVGKLYRLLADVAETQGCEVYFTVVQTQVSATKYRYPDVVVTCEGDTDEYQVQAPCALFEVLSDSTEEVDSTQKLEEYLKLPSLERYVMLRQDRPLALVYRRTEEGWLFEMVEQGEIAVPCLNVGVKIEDIYKGIGVK